jgi:hypothetical protein
VTVALTPQQGRVNHVLGLQEVEEIFAKDVRSLVGCGARTTIHCA